jgi:hypothetical protein
MTEEEYKKVQTRCYEASGLMQEINRIEETISNIERGRQRIDINVGTFIISNEMSDEVFNKIKDIVLKHYQNKLSEIKQKFEEL